MSGNDILLKQCNFLMMLCFWEFIVLLKCEGWPKEMENIVDDVAIQAKVHSGFPFWSIFITAHEFFSEQ